MLDSIYPILTRVATFYRYKNGWRVQVARRGVRKSATFPSKGAAQSWAGRIEAEIMAGVRGEVPNLTVQALFVRYAEEVSAGKKGARWEVIRLKALGRDPLAAVRLRQLDAPHVSDWQRRRLQAVSAASVRRERNLLNNVFQIGIREWRWLRKNPFEGVRRPRDGKPRTRIATPAELDALLAKASDKLRRVIVWAVETGMRAGEIASLRRVEGRVAYIADSKNDQAREVPLSVVAQDAWSAGGFGITAGSISAIFARLCVECGIEGLTFHDLRRTAIVRLAAKLNPWELAKMVGHRDMKMTLNVYYQSDAAEVAKKL